MHSPAAPTEPRSNETSCHTDGQALGSKPHQPARRREQLCETRLRRASARGTSGVLRARKAPQNLEESVCEERAIGSVGNGNGTRHRTPPTRDAGTRLIQVTAAGRAASLSHPGLLFNSRTGFISMYAGGLPASGSCPEGAGASPSAGLALPLRGLPSGRHGLAAPARPHGTVPGWR